jgi:regulatory protein
MPRPPASRRPASPLNAARLGELALAYVARFATSEARLARYLVRKLRERGWTAVVPADVAIGAAVARCAALGFVDDAGFAEARGGALTRRGLGARRVQAQLAADGIAADTAAPVVTAAGERGLATALAFARRRRLGPYAREPLADPKARARAMGAFLRAGHDSAVVRRILAVAPGDAAALAELDEADAAG